MRIRHLTLAVTLSLSFVSFQPFFSKGLGQDTPSTPTRKVIRKKGWEIPGRNEMTIAARADPVERDGVKVDVRLLRARSDKEPLSMVDFFGEDANGNIVITSGLFVVRSLVEYQAKGNTFAYQVNLVQADLHRESAGTKYGAAMVVFYVDEDGDGLFESKYDNTDLPKLPAWIKDQR